MAHYNVSAAGALARGHRILVLVARWTTALLQSRCRLSRWSSTALALLLASTAFATTYYSYDSLGRVTQAVESNGTTTQYTYDADGNITSITRTAGSSTLTIGAISTPSGAVGSSITINGSGFSSIPSQNTVTINGVAAQVTYASDNRLLQVQSAGTSTYTFNDDGTIASRSDDTEHDYSVVPGAATFSVSGTSNQLATITGAMTRTYSYDQAGNTTSTGGPTFTYNAAGRLVSAAQGSSTTSFAVNALGQRVRNPPYRWGHVVRL